MVDDFVRKGGGSGGCTLWMLVGWSWMVMGKINLRSLDSWEKKIAGHINKECFRVPRVGFPKTVACICETLQSQDAETIPN